MNWRSCRSCLNHFDWALIEALGLTARNFQMNVVDVAAAYFADYHIRHHAGVAS